MWVKCNSSECEHNRDDYCMLHCVYINDGQCSEYKDYLDNNSLYQCVYYKRCRTTHDGKQIDCRVRAKGMRYEWEGLVLYTENDIRYSIGEASFTEEITGLLLGGYDIKTKGKSLAEVARKHIANLRPVLDLPLYEMDKATHDLVPHKESLDEILAPNGVSGDLAP